MPCMASRGHSMILSSFNTACFGDHKGRQNQGQLTNYLGDVDIGDGFGVLWGKGLTWKGGIPL